MTSPAPALQTLPPSPQFPPRSPTPFCPQNHSLHIISSLFAKRYAFPHGSGGCGSSGSSDDRLSLLYLLRPRRVFHSADGVYHGSVVIVVVAVCLFDPTMVRKPCSSVTKQQTFGGCITAFGAGRGREPVAAIVSPVLFWRLYLCSIFRLWKIFWEVYFYCDSGGTLMSSQFRFAEPQSGFYALREPMYNQYDE